VYSWFTTAATTDGSGANAIIVPAGICHHGMTLSMYGQFAFAKA
jgi:hypothetical protein